jgi:hypothetical protein
MEEFGPVLWEEGEEFMDKNHEIRPGSGPE